MKKFTLVLWILGLMVVWGAQAMAVDVKISGEYYVAGMYQDKIGVNKAGPYTYINPLTGGTVTVPNGELSTAFYFQRLRLKTTFVVAAGLYFIARADIMERSWGATRSTPGTSTDIASSGTRAENENIAFDLGYVQYISPIGMFIVGYQDDGAWGTVFGDSTLPLGKIQYVGVFGPVAAIVYAGKFKDQSNSAIAAATATDRDIDMYVAAVNYKFKQGATGLLIKHYRSALPRNPIYGEFKQQFTAAVPYVKAKIGPVAVQAELIYGFGDYMKYENAGTDSKLDNLAGWVDATADFGVAYFGGTLAYVAGDDPGTTDKKEGGVITGGTDWNPTLLLFNFDRYYWAGSMYGYQYSATGATRNPNGNDNPFLATHDGGMTNAWFFQLRGGVRPIDKLDILASVSYANADRKPAGVLNNDYGWEVDVTGTYKITNNLSYMIGGAYLFTGKFFKGNDDNNELNDNYLILNKLSLTF